MKNKFVFNKAVAAGLMLTSIVSPFVTNPATAPTPEPQKPVPATGQEEVSPFGIAGGIAAIAAAALAFIGYKRSKRDDDIEK